MPLVVFDWDGTLADSVSKIIQCKQFLARKYNLDIPTPETIKYVLGTKFEDAMKQCFPLATNDCLQKLGLEFHELMQTQEYQAELFPNAKVILEILKKQGFILAIATSKNTNELAIAIDYHKLTDIFDITCCGNDYQGKPDPMMLYHIMECCKVTADETIMIGDTTTDITFAKNAGIKVVAVTFGAHSKEKLQSLLPDHFIDDFMQLPQLAEALLCSSKTIYSCS